MLMSSTAKSIEPAVSVLAHHGKSFRFAGRFLDKKQLEDCARLYRFCRFVDDLVDEVSDADAAQVELDFLKRDLERGHSSMPVVEDFIDLASQCQMQSEVILELIRGIESDLQQVLVSTDADLLRYCYRVAGTVGLLMCDVLGVQDPKAKAHAIDLGIGMQLTNIARDVQEDAGMGRRYIPGQWLGEIAPQALSNPSTRESELLVESARRLLSLAELYYESGKAGLRFLPPRARQGIKVAASVYREIGLVIAARGFDVSAGRAYVGLPRKLLVACRALLFDPCTKTYAPHQPGLHVHLKGLPYANQSS